MKYKTEFKENNVEIIVNGHTYLKRMFI